MTASNVIFLHRDRPRLLAEYQQMERCVTRARKTRAEEDSDLQRRIAIGLRKLAAATPGGSDAVADGSGVDRRTFRKWQAEGAALPRTADLFRVARQHPDFADLLSDLLGLPKPALTAADVAALRQAHAAAGQALAKLDDTAGQLALFG